MKQPRARTHTAYSFIISPFYITMDLSFILSYPNLALILSDETHCKLSYKTLTHSLSVFSLLKNASCIITIHAMLSCFVRLRSYDCGPPPPTLLPSHLYTHYTRAHALGHVCSPHPLHIKVTFSSLLCKLCTRFT